MGSILQCSNDDYHLIQFAIKVLQIAIVQSFFMICWIVKFTNCLSSNLFVVSNALLWKWALFFFLFHTKIIFFDFNIWIIIHASYSFYKSDHQCMVKFQGFPLFYSTFNEIFNEQSCVIQLSKCVFFKFNTDLARYKIWLSLSKLPGEVLFQSRGLTQVLIIISKVKRWRNNIWNLIW